MTRICFVCDEIFPTRTGGAGSVIYNLTHDLLDRGHQVFLLLNLSKAEFERFNLKDRLDLPNPEQCRAFHVASLCKGAPFHEQDFNSRYDWESSCYDYACRQVYQKEQPDLIEFVDYCGPAYYALCARMAGISYQRSRIVIRLHGAIELIDRCSKARSLDFDRYTIYALERNALRMADAVLFAAESFLQEYYPEESGSWPGEKRLSPPLVKDIFAPFAIDPNANIVLFYGRLYAQKGADLFVDAAVGHLIAHPNSALEFHLVGYDSPEPPVEGLRSYREYLLTRIPAQYHRRVTFHGFIAPDRMAQILPLVRFAVFPSYFETFCMAAHELHNVGVPLIVSSIPAFRDHFRPNIDALFFDGTLSDLICKIAFLDSNVTLRKELSRLPTPSHNSTLDFYERPSLVSINHKKGIRRVDEFSLRLLVCIVTESPDEKLLTRTLASLENASSSQLQILILQKNGSEAALSLATWLLGSLYSLHDEGGHPVTAQQVFTQDALLILRAGDEVDVGYLALGLESLYLNPQLAFISCWKWIIGPKGNGLNTFPLAAMIELLPFEFPSPFTRCILRTPPNVLLIDLLDPQAGVMAEIAYLWKLTENDKIGIQIPAAMLTKSAETIKKEDDSLLSYLVMHDSSRIRQILLTRYLAMLVHVNPASYFSLHSYWARTSHLTTAYSSNQEMSDFIRSSRRACWIKKLERGGRLSRWVVTVLRKLKAVLE